MLRSVDGLTTEQQFTQQEQLIERWRDNKALFIKQCLGGKYKLLKPFQGKMVLQKGEIHMGRYITMRLLPRDSGKSWIGTIADSIHEMVFDPNITMQYIAEAQETAIMFLSETKQNLEGNTTIHEFFGEHHKKTLTWSAKKIVSGFRTEPRKEPTIETLGAGGAIVGRHVKRQYMDDLVSDRTSDTEHKRAKLENWYDKMAFPVLEQGGTQCINGTRYFPGELYEHLLNRYGLGILYRVPALLETIMPDGKTEYTSYFPERYSVEVLLALRKANPITFASQYQNEVQLMLSNIINYESLHIIDSSEWPDFTELVFYIGVDPATGLKANSDYFATCTIGYHSLTNRKYVLRSTKNRLGDSDQMLRHIVGEWRWVVENGGQVASIGIESNAFQGVLAKTAWADPAKFGMLPIIEIYTLKDKIQRLIAQAHHYNLGTVYFDEECYELVENLVQFPNIKKDDDVDALMIAMQAVEETQQGCAPFEFDTIDLANNSHVLDSGQSSWRRELDDRTKKVLGISENEGGIVF